MRRTLLKPVAAGLAVSLLAGCVTTGDPNHPLTAAEQRMREQADAYNMTILQGVLAGCAGGAAIGAVSSRNNRGQNALIGCGLGALLGGGTGAYVANKQEQYATKEEQLDATIADVRADNQRLTGLLDATRQVIADDTARIEQVDRDLAAGKITMQQAKTQMASVDDNRAYLDNTLAELRKRQQSYANAAAQLHSADARRNQELNDQIATMEKRVAQLQGERDALVKRRTVSRVG